MSEMAPERPASSGGGNVLRRRLGPLPTWAWILILAAVIVAWAWWRNRQSSQAPQDTSGQVPQFVNQTYTTVQAPVAPKTPPDHDKHRRRHPRHRPRRDREEGAESEEGGKTPPPIPRHHRRAA